MNENSDFVMKDTKLVRYRGEQEHVVIPENVTEIGPRVFEDNMRLVSVTIPEGVVKIGDNAFAGCRHLGEVELPDSDREIGTFAFADCFRMKRVRLGRGLETFGFSPFDTCIALEQVEVRHGTSDRIYDALFDMFHGVPIFTVVTVRDDKQ